MNEAPWESTPHQISHIVAATLREEIFLEQHFADFTVISKISKIWYIFWSKKINSGKEKFLTIREIKFPRFISYALLSDQIFSLF